MERKSQQEYLVILEKFYQEGKGSECPPHNRLAFLGRHVFRFTTYDGKVDEHFSALMIETIKYIVHSAVFKYINKDHMNYMNYLTMVNMPFLKDKLEWGTSIRGAWFDDYTHGSGDDHYVITYDMKIPKSDIKRFIMAILDFSISGIA